MKLSVDRTVCEGHGQCHMAEPELFPLDDTGHSDVGHGREVPDGKEGVARIGVESCPVAALRLERGRR
jgi:ferredoxin